MLITKLFVVILFFVALCWWAKPYQKERKQSKSKIYPEYHAIGMLLFEAMKELASILSVKQALTPERLKPTTAKEVCRKESNGDIVCVYEMLRTGHMPENERIAADKLQLVINQINEMKGHAIVERFKYTESTAQIFIRYIPPRANNTIY